LDSDVGDVSDASDVSDAVFRRTAEKTASASSSSSSSSGFSANFNELKASVLELGVHGQRCAQFDQDGMGLPFTA